MFRLLRSQAEQKNKEQIIVFITSNYEEGMSFSSLPFCVISRQAETVLARVSIGRPTDIELLSEMDVYHTDRVGGSALLLDCDPSAYIALV